MNYYGNNPYYMQDLQNMRDRIDSQLKSLQQQPQAITQNFQIAPSNTSELEGRYANSIDEVKNTFVVKAGLFVNKDLNTLWLKDTNGKIRTFDLTEVVEIDDKDREIRDLKKQIEEMKGMIENARECVVENVDEQITESKPTRVQTNKRTATK